MVPAQAVRKVLRFNGLGHLAAFYDSLAAAVTDQRPGSPTAIGAPQGLDDTVREIRDYTFTAYGQKSPSPPPAADEQARVK